MSNRDCAYVNDPEPRAYFAGLSEGLQQCDWPRFIAWSYEAGRHAAAHLCAAGIRIRGIPPASASDSELASAWVLLRDTIAGAEFGGRLL